MKTFISTFALLAIGCGGGGAMQADTGTAQFRFAVSADAKNSGNLKDPLKGTFYGDIFLQEDVGITGPRSGVTGLQTVEVANIDLTAKDANAPSDVSFTTQGLAPGKYVVLGFLDVDGNGATVHEPDPGDPVTLALTNTFDITKGTETKRLVLFELIYN